MEKWDPPCKLTAVSGGMFRLLAKVSSLLLVDVRAQDVHYFQTFFKFAWICDISLRGAQTWSNLSCPHSASLFSGKKSFRQDFGEFIQRHVCRLYSTRFSAICCSFSAFAAARQEAMNQCLSSLTLSKIVSVWWKLKLLQAHDAKIRPNRKYFVGARIYQQQKHHWNMAQAPKKSTSESLYQIAHRHTKM